MRSKLAIGVIIGVAIGVLLSTAVVVLAGDLNLPSGSTASAAQMVTLEQLYKRLATGAEGTKMAAFKEPSSGPGSTMHTLDDIIAAASAVDDTIGVGVADVASGKAFWGLTSGAWGPQTGTASGGTYPAPVPSIGQTTSYAPLAILGMWYGAPVPRTGQTTSYATGDDGDLKRGVPWPVPRFTDNLDGTVTDNLTGLIWLKDAACLGTLPWGNALTASNTLKNGECDLSDGSAEGDWRLPNVRELQSLVDYGQYNPGLPSGHPFEGVQSHFYWSGTTHAHVTFVAWYVDLTNGHVLNDGKIAAHYVWPVRGGQ